MSHPEALRPYSLPLDSLPDGYIYDAKLTSEADSKLSSAKAAFKYDIGRRDTYNGKLVCIVCGTEKSLKCCHIIPENETDTTVSINNHTFKTSSTYTDLLRTESGVT